MGKGTPATRVFLLRVSKEMGCGWRSVEECENEVVISAVFLGSCKGVGKRQILRGLGLGGVEVGADDL